MTIRRWCISSSNLVLDSRPSAIVVVFATVVSIDPRAMNLRSTLNAVQSLQHGLVCRGYLSTDLDDLKWLRLVTSCRMLVPLALQMSDMKVT